MTGPRAAAGAARVRITAWTSAVVAMVLLAVTLLTYALMLRQVGEQANWTIEQQLRELEIFARDGVDPSTGQRFSSMPALIQGFVTSQTPYPGQAIIGIAGPDQTPVVADATPQDLGRRLAADPARLARLRDMPEASGIIDSDQGELRWGRQQVQIQAADGKQTGLVLVVCFTQPERRLARQRALVVGLVSMLGLAAVTAATWVVSHLVCPDRCPGTVHATARSGARLVAPGRRVDLVFSDRLASGARQTRATAGSGERGVRLPAPVPGRGAGLVRRAPAPDREGTRHLGGRRPGA